MPRVRPPLAKLLAFAIAAAILPVAAAGTEDELVVVVAPGSGHRIEGRDILAAIYRRKKQYWNDGQRIEPVNLPPDDPRRQRFSLLVLGLMPQQLDGFWNEMYFHGVLPPHVLASVEAVIRFVSTTPAAIGYTPLCSADTRVALAVAIDGQGGIIDKPSQDGCPR
jgi:hypothetical protein